MKTPSFSLIIPAFNAAKTIERTLNSVVRQTVQPDEIMIGIDACTKTFDALKTILKDFPLTDRIRLFWFGENVGPYVIKNTLVQYTDVDVLMFFDADDIMKDNYAQRMLSIWGPKKVVRPISSNNGNSDKRIVAHGPITISTKDFLNCKGFEPWRCAADTEFLQRINQHGLSEHDSGLIIMDYMRSSNSLTKHPKTRGRSDLRRSYHQVITHRSRNPVFRKELFVTDQVTEKNIEDSTPLIPVNKTISPKDKTAIVASAVNIPTRTINTFIKKMKVFGDIVLIIRQKDTKLNTDDKVALISYTESQFSPSRAANLGIRYAIDKGYEYVLKTDIDCEASRDFLDNQLGPNDLIAPVITMEQKNGVLQKDKTKKLCGTVLASNQIWRTLHGYDERMWGYGMEDGEFLKRARVMGFNVKRSGYIGKIVHRWHPTRINKYRYPLRGSYNKEIPSLCGEWSSPDWGLVNE